MRLSKIDGIPIPDPDDVPLITNEQLERTRLSMPVELCWVKLVGRDHFGNLVTQFNVLLRADMKLRLFHECYDGAIHAEIHEPDITSEQQPVPLVGPGLRIVNLSEM